MYAGVQKPEAAYIDIHIHIDIDIIINITEAFIAGVMHRASTLFGSSSGGAGSIADAQQS
tara:strand:+ start:248 stop:427 length:180 start_codon:yes stop_codon:yes gene_type:complete